MLPSSDAKPTLSSDSLAVRFRIYRTAWKLRDSEEDEVSCDETCEQSNAATTREYLHRLKCQEENSKARIKDLCNIVLPAVGYGNIV